MQTLAWQYVASYGQRANAAVGQNMATCRTLMQKEICPAYSAFRQGKEVPVFTFLKRQLDSYSCRHEYADAHDPQNPFASTRE
jgi:hypothetical protein